MVNKHIYTNKLNYINYLYVVGIVLVVLGHSTIAYKGGWAPVPMKNSAIAIVVNNYIYSFHMPLFFFLSGYVFKHNILSNKYVTYRELIKNKYKRLIVPYILVSIFFLIPIKFILGDYSGKNIITMVFINNILAGRPSQLWFLVTLFNIFIIYYFFIKYFNLTKSVRKKIIFTILFSGLYFISSILPRFLYVFQLINTLKYLLFFHLGYILYDIYNNRKKINLIKVCVIFILQCGFFIITYNYEYKILINLVNAIMVITALLSLSIYLDHRFYKIKDFKLINTLRKYNFEIYLFHQQFILLILESSLIRSLSPIINILITSTTSIILSIFLIKGIRLIKKYFSNLLQ